MAKEIEISCGIPEHIYSSTSQRTRETIGRMMDVWGCDDPIVSYVPEIYLAGVETLYYFIRSIKEYNYVMLVGHNPGMQMLMERFTNRSIENFQTAAYALIEFNIDKWEHVEYGKGDLLEYFYPKMFKEES